MDGLILRERVKGITHTKIPSFFLWGGGGGGGGARKKKKKTPSVMNFNLYGAVTEVTTMKRDAHSKKEEHSGSSDLKVGYA